MHDHDSGRRRFFGIAAMMAMAPMAAQQAFAQAKPAAPKALPKLPVARVVWKALPNLAVAAEAWILAGGAHHTVYSQAVTSEQLRTFAEIFGIEFLLIDGKTEIPAFKNEIVWNECAFSLRR